MHVLGALSPHASQRLVQVVARLRPPPGHCSLGELSHGCLGASALLSCWLWRDQVVLAAPSGVLPLSGPL
eukprot:1814155-Alexandrium_andersonii.AAC.1